MSAYKDTRRANDMLRAQLESERARKEQFAADWRYYSKEIQKFEGWESWWDSYPNQMSKAVFLPILKARVEELQGKE